MKSLLRGLRKTRAILTADIRDLARGRKRIDENSIDELETRLLMSDVGIETTKQVIDQLSKRLSYGDIDTVDSLLKELSNLLTDILETVQQPLSIDTERKPFSILMVGINGSGKTTTVGKLAKRFQQQGYSVALAAGDTFRAAAVEQLQTWGERNQVPVIAQKTGADSASVLFDAIDSARARDLNVLLADTAGRLHTQDGLMAELHKIVRVMQKADAEAPDEILLVLDASIGQNALQQAKQFHEAIGVTGLVITKLDGTAKGGILFAITQQLKLPIRYIGVGESIDDLQPFIARDFVDALLDIDE